MELELEVFNEELAEMGLTDAEIVTLSEHLVVLAAQIIEAILKQQKNADTHSKETRFSCE